MREICQTLDFNKSTFYYQPKIDTSQDVLPTEIQQLAAAYPTYGYTKEARFQTSPAEVEVFASIEMSIYL